MANPVEKIKLSVIDDTMLHHRFTLTQKSDPTSAYDLTSHTAEMHITDDNGTVLHTATTANGHLVIVTAASGILDVKIPADSVSAWTFESANYDLKVIPVTGAEYAVPVARGTVIKYDSPTQLFT